MINAHGDKKKNKISREPQEINKDVWYYEGEKNLDFVVNVKGECVQFKVPVSRMLKSLERIYNCD
jgi:hypothetical protein